MNQPVVGWTQYFAPLGSVNDYSWTGNPVIAAKFGLTYTDSADRYTFNASADLTLDNPTNYSLDNMPENIVIIKSSLATGQTSLGITWEFEHETKGLHNNVFNYNDVDTDRPWDFFLDAGCHSNTFNSQCRSFTFGASCRYNFFYTNCGGSQLGAGCHRNIAGTYFWFNDMASGSRDNAFGNYAQNNRFGY